MLVRPDMKSTTKPKVSQPWVALDQKYPQDIQKLFKICAEWILEVCINIAPWNAPATLSFGPTVSMLAAGNHVVPSVRLFEKQHIPSLKIGTPTPKLKN